MARAKLLQVEEAHVLAFVTSQQWIQTVCFCNLVHDTF